MGPGSVSAASLTYQWGQLIHPMSTSTTMWNRVRWSGFFMKMRLLVSRGHCMLSDTEWHMATLFLQILMQSANHKRQTATAQQTRQLRPHTLKVVATPSANIHHRLDNNTINNANSTSTVCTGRRWEALDVTHTRTHTHSDNLELCTEEQQFHTDSDFPRDQHQVEFERYASTEWRTIERLSCNA